MDSLSGGNPTNNPRLDLLHNTGDNEQLHGAAGTYTAAAAPHVPTSVAAPTSALPVRPAPLPTERPMTPPVPRPEAEKPKPAASYVKTAETTRPATPVPTPAAPEPRRVTPPAQSVAGEHKRRWPAVAGVLVVLLLIAGGATWYIMRGNTADEVAETPKQTVEVELGAPTELSQADDNNNVITATTATKATSIVLHFVLKTSANSGSLTPEVELRPVGTPFTGESTASGKAVTASGSDMDFNVLVDNLSSGAYHWQARLNKSGTPSDWVAFGTDPAAVAFTVDDQAPAVPTIGSVGGTKVSGGTTSATSARPVISGTSDPNAVIKLTVGSQAFKATADASGAWSITPDSDLAAGANQLSFVSSDAAGNDSTATALALTVTTATAAATPAPATPAATPTPTPAAAPAATTLAPTGDNTLSVGMISLLLMAASAAGWIATRRLRDTA